MSKDPAILFYTSDFLTGTYFMNDAQVGQYIRLLCLQHQKGKLSEADMKRVCPKRDPEVFSKFEQDENGLFYNPRLYEEIVKRSKYCESRRANRLKGVASSASEEEDNVIVAGSPEQIRGKKSFEKPNSLVIDDLEETKKRLEEEFNRFWNEYDKKRGDKEKLFKKWCKIPEEDKRKIFEYIPKYKDAQPDKQFRKDPSTFLNNKSWNDELIVKQKTGYVVNNGVKYKVIDENTLEDVATKKRINADVGRLNVTYT